MAEITLKFGTKEYSSLSVNDYVYYVDTNTRGDYVVQKSNTEYKLLGPVKEIKPPVPVVSKNFILDRDHYFELSLVEGSLDNSNADKLNIGYSGSIPDGVDTAQTFNFNGSVVKVGDVVSFTSPQSLSGTTKTITGFKIIGGEVHYDLDSDLSSANLTGIQFKTSSPNRLKIFTEHTSGILVGNYVKGGILPGGNTPTATVTNVVNNTSITLSAPAVSTDGNVNIVFSGDNTSTTLPLEVIVHVANNDVTLPVHSNNPYYFFQKDANVNTSSLLGYYAEVELTNDSTSKAELFSVGTEISESSK